MTYKKPKTIYDLKPRLPCWWTLVLEGRENDITMTASGGGKVLTFIDEASATDAATQWTNADAHLGGFWTPKLITDKELDQRTECLKNAVRSN